MTITAQLHDGTELEFPDGTDPQVIQATVKGLLQQGQPPAPQEQRGTGVGRQLGLTARYGMEGLGSTVGLLAEPFRLGLQYATGKPVASAGQMAASAADAMGLPSPETPTERIVGDVTRTMAGAGGIGAAARGASAAVPAVRALGENMGRQAVGAASAGAAGGIAREDGAGPWGQFAASLVGGLAGPSVYNALAGAGTKIANAVRNAMTPAPQIETRLTQILGAQGIDWNALSAQARASLMEDYTNAMRTGADLDPAAMARLADYRALGATPRRGNLTLDPVDITRERNAAKIIANTSVGQAYGLPRIEAENNQRLISTLENLSGNRPVDPYAAGAAAAGTVRARDAAAAATERRLYDQARTAAGQDIPLDRAGFINRVDQLLVADNKSAFLPPEIRRMLNTISYGQIQRGGQTFDVPFDVRTIDSLKTTLATAQRGAADGNVRRAIGLVRQALDETPPTQVGAGAPPAKGGPGPLPAPGAGGNLPQEALDALDKARRFARARRTWQESAAGIEGAVNDAAPDTFMRRYILGQGGEASAADVGRLANTLRRYPAAMEEVKGQIVNFLRDSAARAPQGQRGNFGQATYNKALDAIGDRKLQLFFTPEEIQQLRAVGRVGFYEAFQPKGSAVNNSNSGALVVGKGIDALSRAANMLPLGREAISVPINYIYGQGATANALRLNPALRVPQDMPPPYANALLSGLLATQTVDER